MRPRRRAIDFVGQQHVRKDGARQEFKLPDFLVEDVEPRNVAGKQVGRALHPRKAAVHRVSEGLGERRLPQAGQIVKQQMAARQEAGEHQLRHLLLADQCAVQRTAHRFDRLPTVDARRVLQRGTSSRLAVVCDSHQHLAFAGLAPSRRVRIVLKDAARTAVRHICFTLIAGTGASSPACGA